MWNILDSGLINKQSRLETFQLMGLSSWMGWSGCGYRGGDVVEVDVNTAMEVVVVMEEEVVDTKVMDTN